jgi:hypothetical protein
MTHNEGPWKESQPNAVISKKSLKRYFDSVITPQKPLPPLTEAEKEEVRSILLKAESDGEIDLSQFCE